MVTKTKKELEEELKAVKEKAAEELAEAAAAKAAAIEEAEEAKAAAEELAKVQAELEQADEEPEPEPEPDTVRFCGRPGYEMIGFPQFPFETSNPDIIARLRGTKAFRYGRIWEDNRSDSELAAAEEALSGVSYSKLRKIAEKLGLRDLNRYSKVELLEAIENEGNR